VLQATGITLEIAVLEVASCTYVLHTSILEVAEKRVGKLKVSHALSRGLLPWVVLMREPRLKART
jgi:hypothetical protein